MSEKEQNYLLPFCMHELFNFLVATGFCFCVGARHVLFVVACFSSPGKMDAVSFFCQGIRRCKNCLLIYSSLDFGMTGMNTPGHRIF